MSKRTCRAHSISKCFICIIITSCQPAGIRDRGDTLELTEIWSHQLPDSFALVGIAGTLNRLLYWSNSQKYLLERGESGAFRVIRTASSAPPLAARGLGEEGLVEFVVLDSSQPRTLQVSSDTVRTLALPRGRVSSARFIRDSWFFAATDSTEHVVYKLNHGSLRRFFSRPNTGPRGVPGFVLGEWDHGPLISLVSAPFANYLINDRGVVEREFVPKVSFESTGRPSSVSIVSLSTLRLDSGYLQIIANPRSFARTLVTYDDHGAMRKSIQIEAPLGFISSFPARKTLLALRELGHQEIVAYQWHWVPSAVKP